MSERDERLAELCIEAQKHADWSYGELFSYQSVLWLLDQFAAVEAKQDRLREALEWALGEIEHCECDAPERYEPARALLARASQDGQEEDDA